MKPRPNSSPRLSCLLVLAILANVAIATAAQAQSRVLFLGDSMSMGAFGRTFDQALRSEDFQVYTYVAGGASPYYWLRRYESISCSIGYWEKTPANERRVGYVRAVPKVEDLIDDFKPNIVVVQTGVNLYATLRSKQRTHEENVEIIEDLISDMCRAVHRSGAYSYWITPPESHPNRYSEELQDELAKIMKKVVGDFGGSVFESGEVTRWTEPYPSQSDGIHYGPIEAKEWAVQVANNFKTYAGALKKPEPAAAAEPAPVIEASPLRATPITPAPSPEDPDSDPAPPAAAETIGAPREPDDSASDEIEVKLRLRKKSVIESMNEVSYNNAFGLYEYEVEEVYKGEYPADTVRVAHMLVLHKKFTGSIKFEVGKSYYLTLVKIDKYPSLQRVQIVDDLPMDLDLPIYICKF